MLVIFLLFMIAVLLYYILKTLNATKPVAPVRTTPSWLTAPPIGPIGLLVFAAFSVGPAILLVDWMFGITGPGWVFYASVGLALGYFVERNASSPGSPDAKSTEVRNSRFEFGKRCRSCNEKLMNAARACPKCGTECG